MALKAILSRRVDFTGEFPAEWAKSGLWRFDKTEFGKNASLPDSSGSGRNFVISGWGGTTAKLWDGYKGRYFLFNIHDPATEKTHLKVENDGSIFENLGGRIIVGGWICPTTYSIGNTYCPIFNTRQGPGKPIFYISLYQGRPRLMLYNSSGTLLIDRAYTPSFSMVNGGWYFIAAVIKPNEKKMCLCLGDQASGALWVSAEDTFTGELNRSCTADLIMGMHANTYYYAGGLDDWFLDVDSELTMDDLAAFFHGSCTANGGDMSGTVDALTGNGVCLRKSGSTYPSEGVLYTMPVECNLSGIGRVSVTSEYISGVTAVSQIATSTSDDLVSWSDWAAVGTDGKLVSPNRAYIRFKVTLTTTDTSKTPVLTDIRLFDIPRAPYERIGFARPIVLDSSGAWEAVLENAYAIIVTGEVNGEDTLTFKIPYLDSKRKYIENEKKIQIVNDIYKVRTITDVKDSDGSITTTQVYAEAEFYDLSVAAQKAEKAFDAAGAKTPMQYALSGTGWTVGRVEVQTYRTWTCQEKNPLSILRSVADLYGGDLVFDCLNRQVHLLSMSGKNSGALFAYRKNMKSIKRVIDTRSLVTRLYAVGANGMTFAAINGGKPYLEDYTYCSDVRVASLDCSAFTNPYQMRDFTNMRLAQYCKPSVSYVLKAMDLSVLTGYEHEAWGLGDYVRVEDKELGLSATTRVVRREYNLQEPWNTVLELSTKLKNLGSSASQWDSAADAGGGSGDDVSDMVPFNHLRNSRADDGLAYWTSSGFQAVGGTGVSGTAAFRADGVAGSTLSLSQTVYPSSRSSYTLSAQIATEGLQKLGDDSQVGIEVEFEYEDGTTETRFVNLF